MATLIITPAQLELINSLSEEEIPIKLRCAICSRLAVNAFRLPCCDQAICETCQSTLPTTCPVCEHSPVSAEDCKPHKALRTTIKVFLRTEEKKREALRLKEIKEATPIPVETPTPVEIPIQESSEIAEATNNESTPAEQPTTDIVHDAEQNIEAEKDVPHPSIEEISAAQEPVETNSEDANITEGNENGVEQLEPTDEAAKEGSKGPTVGPDGMATGGFPAMGMGGDFNQMQMLMAMQNGMGAGGFGNFPMMGMPGMNMNMDPMMMQNMFMNGGFGAGSMGMNGMNMGMGMGGFDGGVGGAGYNNWNGQQSWNVGPDNFNHPNAAGMMGHGDYRANNSGYAPNASGFNPQGNYGRSQYNDFQNNGYGNNQGYQARGRGRGRGFGGRGGFGYGAQDFSHQIPPKFGQQQNGPSSETGSIPKGPKSETGAATNVDEYGRELRPKSESRVPEAEQPEGEPAVAVAEEAKEDAAENVTDEPQGEVQDSKPMPIRSLEEEENAAAYGNAGYNNPYGQGAYSNPQYGGRNGYMQPPVKVVDVPINAPTGPKAMREGLPNVGFRGRPAYPVPVVGVVARTNGSVSGSVAPESERGGDREREVEPERERERKRSRSRDRTHRSSRRHRSDEELSEDEKETERRRERRRERRKLREEEDEARAKDERDRGDEEDVKKDDNEEARSRSASPRRSSHRSSRRDKDKYRDSDKDSKYRERDRDEHKSSRHRSHRSRHEERSRSRDRDRNRERRRHSRRESVEPETPVDDVEDKERRESIVSTTANGLEIKGASSRRKPLSSSAVEIPSGPRSERADKDKERSSHHSSSRRRDEESRPSKDNRESNSHSHSRRESKSSATGTGSAAVGALDPHTQERLRRDNERIQKEMRKLAALNGGGAGSKRSREEVDAGKSGRKKGRRGGVVVDGEHDEERVKRLEAEREGSRWA